MRRISYHGPQADTRFHDGGLRPVIGACHIQVMRANRAHPELSQGTDYTYNHAPMLCRWHGKFYLMYLSSPVHEHGGLAVAMLATSKDGFEWSVPEMIFPSLPVPRGIYRGKDADRLPENAMSVVHHRMGFYRAPNDVLLVMTHHGVSPRIHAAPNSGYGIGRTVRRINVDGTLGDIYVLRVNTQAGWQKAHFPYPMFDESGDSEFVAACNALLNDRAANGAWWEEERLDTNFFPLKNMRAPSFHELPDGNLSAIGKDGLFAISSNGGESWTTPEKADGIHTSGGKCSLTRTSDGKYAILYNPSPDGQHRWPLAVITGDNGYDYENMLCAGGEVPPMRYGGMLKNFGLNYIRAIMPGNDDSPDGCTWLTYSMNKEDIWVVRLPGRITGTETGAVHDDFSEMSGPVPERWHTYSPQWARVRLEDGCLALRDSEPWDYAKAMRTFPVSNKAEINIKLSAVGSANGELQIDVSDHKGMNAVRIILAADGTLRMRAGEGDWPLGSFADGEEMEISLIIDCERQRAVAIVNGVEAKERALMCPVASVERLTLRTGNVRTWPTPEDNLKNIQFPDYENPGERLPEAVYRIASVSII